MATQKNKIIAAIACLALVIVIASAWFMGGSNKSAADVSGSATAAFAEGTHYQTVKSPLSSSATRTPDGKVSVIEFFWYGCPHCQAFEPDVRQWLASAPADVAFQQIPVAWNETTTLHAALFYVAESGDNTEQLHDKLFDKIIAIRQERNLASQLEQIAALYTEHGINESEVKGLVESAAIRARVVESESLMRQAEVSSTPTLLVDGQWLVLNNEDVSKVGGPFGVVDYLVQKARTAK